MKNQSPLARAASGLLLAAATLALTACGQNLYKFPQFNFAGRPIPPSQLANRVMVAISTPSTTSSGQLEILDANLDIRNNIQNTVYGFFINGYSGRLPTSIANFPEQSLGFVYGSGDGSYTRVSYANESTLGVVSGLPPSSDSIATISSGAQIYAASTTSSVVVVIDNVLGRVVALNLPGAQHIVTNTGGSVILVTTRNTNNVYRIVKLNNNVLPPAGTYNDCEPLNLPVYCVVPVSGTFDRPTGVVFSLDGSTAYVLNCGPECGGSASGITVLNTTNLNVNYIPVLSPAPAPITRFSITNNVVTFTANNTFSPGQNVTISGLAAGTYLNGQTLVVGSNPTATAFTAGFVHADVPSTVDSGTATLFTIAPFTVAIPGGATVGLTDGVNLYVAGQQLLTTGPAAGRFTGELTVLSLASGTPVAGTPLSIPDGTHSSLIFADDNTLWIGSTLCSNGAKGLLAQSQPAGTINLNCLAAYKLGTNTTPTVVPAVSPGNPVTYPNQDNNQYYYGDLTSICWVQNLHKVYTAYGGQVHAFHTGDLTEINNFQITVQGTVENVVYMDALTNAAN